MSGPSWLVDPNRIATKIRSASGANPREIQWKSNPTKSCPNCHYVMDNSDVHHAWPGLPQGVKFDPTDHEIIWHLLAKVGNQDVKPHPFIDEFIPTVEEEDGICYTHPQNLPGVKQDGSVSHFFHRAIKAYSTGTRKRRKINGDNSGDVRWHKTGRTKPVVLDGVQRGCKKIMVLYISPGRGGKAEKTYWVMHQYHLGTGEDEKEGEYVISKVFYQQQATKQTDKGEEEISEAIHTKVDPVTPKAATPEPRPERRSSTCEGLQDSIAPSMELPRNTADNELEIEQEQSDDDEVNNDGGDEVNKSWENESPYLLSSQQLVEAISLCEDLLQSQSSPVKGKALLSEYAAGLGADQLKRDLEECQNMNMAAAIDPSNIELETPPDFRLSQLEFESQDSYMIHRMGWKLPMREDVRPPNQIGEPFFVNNMISYWCSNNASDVILHEYYSASKLYDIVFLLQFIMCCSCLFYFTNHLQLWFEPNV